MEASRVWAYCAASFSQHREDARSETASKSASGTVVATVLLPEVPGKCLAVQVTRTWSPLLGMPVYVSIIFRPEGVRYICQASFSIYEGGTPPMGNSSALTTENPSSNGSGGFDGP